MIEAFHWGRRVDSGSRRRRYSLNVSDRRKEGRLNEVGMDMVGEKKIDRRGRIIGDRDDEEGVKRESGRVGTLSCFKGI